MIMMMMNWWWIDDSDDDELIMVMMMMMMMNCWWWVHFACALFDSKFARGLSKSRRTYEHHETFTRQSAKWKVSWVVLPYLFWQSHSYFEDGDRGHCFHGHEGGQLHCLYFWLRVAASRQLLWLAIQPKWMQASAPGSLCHWLSSTADILGLGLTADSGSCLDAAARSQKENSGQLYAFLLGWHFVLKGFSPQEAGPWTEISEDSEIKTERFL